MIDPVADLLAEYKAALDEAARREAEAEYQEHHRKVVLAEQMDRALPEWKADATARTSQAYIEKLNELANAKKAAGIARSRATHINRRLDIWIARTALQTAKIERGLA